MPKTYVNERKTEYWTSRAIERFFLSLGFEIRALPIGGKAEEHLPADFLFFDKHTCKIFGFQYKALYHNGGDFWKLTASQHASLARFPWIYYCLSEVRNVSEWNEALHFARILPGRITYNPKLQVSRGSAFPFYIRWAAFYRALENCTKGHRLASSDELRKLILSAGSDILVKETADEAVDLFAVDLDSKRLIHYVPYTFVDLQ
jgi:hypothetical protein